MPAPVFGADGGEMGPFGFGGEAGFATYVRAKEVEGQHQKVKGPAGGSESREDDGEQDESNEEGDAEDVRDGGLGERAERVDFSFWPALIGDAGLEAGSGTKGDDAACKEQDYLEGKEGGEMGRSVVWERPGIEGREEGAGGDDATEAAERG